MTADSECIDMQVIDTILKERSDVPVSRPDDVPDIAMNKDLSWFCIAGNLWCNPGVRTADHHDMRSLTLEEI